MDAVTVAAGDIAFLVLAGSPRRRECGWSSWQARQVALRSLAERISSPVDDPADALAAARLHVCGAIAMTRRALTGIGRAFQIALLAMNRSRVAVDLAFMTALAGVGPGEPPAGAAAWTLFNPARPKISPAMPMLPIRLNRLYSLTATPFE